jgi:hypothetical protein
MLCPFTMLMSSPWKKSPNVPPRTKNKAWIFVNSFSFIFLEFSRRFTRTTFSHGLRRRKKGGTRETGPDRPPRHGGSAGQVRPAQVGPDGVSPRFLPELLLFDFLLRSENFKGSLNKEMRFLGFSFSDYLFDRIGSSGINPIKQYFAPTQQPWRPRGAYS